MTGTVDNSGLLKGIVPTPPKTTGDDKKDLGAAINWIWQLYQVVELQQTFVTNASQHNSTFNPSSLPSPQSSNIATAQQTANSAYILADEAETDAVAAQATATAADNRTNKWVHGSFTISDPATSSVVTLSPAQTDTSYDVLVTPSDNSGAPVSDSFIVSKVTKATGSFTVDIKSAPGGGNSVTFNYLLVRF